MRIEKIAIEYETRYIAEDGTQWRTKWLCEQYEELLKDHSPLKNLKFFNSKGEPIDVFALGEIPVFCYLVLNEELKNYDWSVVKAIIGNKSNDEISYNLPTSKGIWYNDWSNAYNGGYGHNGWKQEYNIEYLENEIKSYQDKIKLFKKITKTS